MKTMRKAAALALASTAMLVLAACSSDSIPTGESEATETAVEEANDFPAADIVAGVEVDDEIAALLPSEFADRGSLTIGSNIQYAPANYYAADGTTPTGYEVDLATSMAARLGVEVEYVDAPFENLITSLQSGRVDFTMAGMNDRPDRQELVDFIDYFETGIGILVAEGNPDGIAQPEDLCGHSVTAGVSSSQEDWALALSDECEANGNDPIDVVTVNDDTQRLNSVKTGRVTAELNDIVNVVYVANTADGGTAFEVVDLPPLEGALYGAGVAKENSDLRDALAASLQSLIDDGTYAQILEAWDLSSGAIETVSINGGK